jgi:uncharacterized Zn finger protein (UPF0148 family)
VWSCPICGDRLIKEDKEEEEEEEKFSSVFDNDTPRLVCRPCDIYYTFNNLNSIINGQ